LWPEQIKSTDLSYCRCLVTSASIISRSKLVRFLTEEGFMLQQKLQ